MGVAKAASSLLSSLPALNATSLLSMTANEDGCWPTLTLGASLHFAKHKKRMKKISGNSSSKTSGCEKVQTQQQQGCSQLPSVLQFMSRLRITFYFFICQGSNVIVVG